MAFLNKNEDVIQIKLTQFGKTLLSQGAWKPAFYQFFDDNVLYDSSRAGNVETQNDIQDRIKSSLALETKYINHSLENRHELETEKIEDGSRELFMTLHKNQKTKEKEGLLRNPINKCSLGSQNAPTFSLNCFDAGINTTKGLEYVTESYSSLKIPQFDIEGEYELVQDLTKQTSEPSDDLYDGETYISLASKKVQFMDNTTIEIKPEELAILLKEVNVPLIEDGFTVEFFEIDAQGEPVPIMTKASLDEIIYIKKDDQAEKVVDDSVPTRNFFMNS